MGEYLPRRSVPGPGKLRVLAVLLPLLASGWLGSARADEVPAVNGSSVGRWDDDALVIETTRFTDNNSGLAQGIPSGPQKRLTERFELIDDGAGMRYSYAFEDPEYLAEPVSGEGRWDYRPDLSPDPVECDLESAGRYLDE